MDPEVEQLRARVAQLERELAEQAARTNALIAAAQEKTYWLDRTGLDLNALMKRPAVLKLYTLAGRARHLARKVRR